MKRFVSALLVLLPLGCEAPAPAGTDRAPASSQAARWNTACPMSGRAVDVESYFEHEGRRVYFCNPKCAAEGAQAPEYWLEQVYGS